MVTAGIRPFEPSEAEALRDLIHRTIDACYSGVYPPRAVAFFKEYHSLDRILDRHAAGEVLVAVRDGALVGTGSLVGHEISGVFVEPALQGEGIGTALMDRLEAAALGAGEKSVELAVSLPSRGFYERRGYRVLEDRSFDVGEGERLDYWAASKTLP